MDKNLKKNLKALFDVIISEAEKNEDFADALYNIFSQNTSLNNENKSSGNKRGNRRDKAVLDPIKLAEEGALTTEILENLSEKELKDIIADYGMDSSKLAMKWKDKSRLVQLILDTSSRRASKGDAFRA